MAEKDYPSYLPKPLRNDYGIQHVSPFARTEMTTGRARQRRTFTTVPSVVSVNWYMDGAKAQLFEAWFRYEITDGAEWFNIDLKTPVGDFAPYECRFVEMYDGPSIDSANNWRFSAQLEIRERPILDQQWWTYGQEFVAGSSIIDIALNSKWPEA